MKKDPKSGNGAQAADKTGRSPAQIRAHAASMVSQVVDQGRSLDALFTARSGRSESDQERGLTRSLVYGTIRWHGRLLAVLNKLSARPVDEMDEQLRALLCVGLFQLLHTDIAAHAVVSETVEAARVMNQPQAAGFVNAILRRCQREGAALAASVDADIGAATSHPAWLVQRLKADWPDAFESILAANNEHPPFWLRVNALRGSRETYLQRLADLGLAAEASTVSPHAVRLTAPVDVRQLPGFESGDVSVQDAAAQLAALLLAVEPGDRVLDACAAPGGKTCHILELQPALNEMVAVDVSPSRLRRVAENLERLAQSATLIAGDAAEPQKWWDGRPFQRILLDVPCSATGVIRRHPDIKWLRREADIDALAERQRALLSQLWPLLAPRGRLLYASCSALQAENATVVRAFIESRSDVRDATPAAAAALQSAGFLNAFSAQRPGLAIAAGAAQMDGFYYACLEKVAADG
jgi:16S rRNA (cytosine967-C5)-methyltransferase